MIFLGGHAEIQLEERKVKRLLCLLHLQGGKREILIFHKLVCQERKEKKRMRKYVKNFLSDPIIFSLFIWRESSL